ncbi:methionine ABC transporter ATP-binding protein [Clostridium cellulovorans]|uniref:ABC transporter related n=1 Tax=Clostridium cellulovorans (strain ATCC 35296 / DSM 3052 / OCM 3 / 743B) TaxID=573061 RepID=D9SRE8_CLOC7|nr:ATP-binding cassette domain-containing protein [Clostridium cellulovorans]ADL52377.1 ABC transporter related [Clostridium cellulovorans 743B]
MIKIKNLEKRFSNEPILKSIDLEIKKGEIFGLVGHSGAGKSTLLRCLNGLETYDKGSIEVMGKEVKSLKSGQLRLFRKDLGMIFQHFSLLERKNVYENIALPLEVWGYDKKETKKRVEKLLKIVHLEDKIYAKPRELSGGQKQRVAIARALALEPKILLSDEATSALDPNTTKSILSLLREINENLGITIVIVTHQMEVVREVCHRVAVLDKGAVVVSGDVEDIFLKQPKALKKLISEEELIPDTGKNIKIYFPKENSETTLITSMARELDIDFSIVWGRLERFRDDVLGSLVINIKDVEFERVSKYLDSKNIGWEVV